MAWTPEAAIKSVSVVVPGQQTVCSSTGKAGHINSPCSSPETERSYYINAGWPRIFGNYLNFQFVYAHYMALHNQMAPRPGWLNQHHKSDMENSPKWQTYIGVGFKWEPPLFRHVCCLIWVKTDACKRCTLAEMRPRRQMTARTGFLVYSHVTGQSGWRSWLDPSPPRSHVPDRGRPIAAADWLAWSRIALETATCCAVALLSLPLPISIVILS